MQDMDKITQMVGSEDASPEEEQQYQQAYEYALQSLHTGEVSKNTVGRVANAKSVASGVAEAVFVILRRTEVHMEALDDAVKIQLGEDLVTEVLALMVDSERIPEGEINDKLIEDIVTQLYTMYAKDADERGELDPSKVQEDVDAGMQMQKPDGMSAMSNQEVSERGLMNV